MQVQFIFFTGFLALFSSCSAFNLEAENKDSLFSNDFHVVNVDFDEETGESIFRRWNPTPEEIYSANTIFKNIKRSPTLDPTSANRNLPKHIAPQDKNRRTDYIDLGRKLSWSRQSGSVDAVVELVIVCDKEFSDIFNQNNNRIIEYLTIYMWDVNLRYKSLPSNRVSFRVNGVVVISNFGAQPFIEESRNTTTGQAEFGRILDKYSKWVYRQRNSIPKFDLAPLITNAKLEWGGGLAYMNAACWVDTTDGRDVGTSVWNDNGGWNSVTVAAHELGHNLGAPHDDDGDFPGGCSERGFIMSGGNENYRYFFSSCSDRLISSFVRSNGASCLRSIQGPSTPQIDPSFSAYKAPTMEEQCKRVLETQTAYIEKQDTYNCKTMRCIKPDVGFVWIYSIAPAENIQCGDTGRCFRGKCRQEGFNIRNAGSGLCMRDTNRFDFMTLIDMRPCVSNGTPLDKFLVETSTRGTTLATPFTLNGNKENGEKCLWTGNAEGNAIWTDRCDSNNSWHTWDLRNAGNGRFLLVHKVTGRCAKPSNRNVGSQIQTFVACNSNDVDMLWTRSL